MGWFETRMLRDDIALQFKSEGKLNKIEYLRSVTRNLNTSASASHATSALP